MPSGRKGKKVGLRSQIAQKSSSLAPLKTGKKLIPSALHHCTRSGLRSGPRSGHLTESTWSFQDNPEFILRRPHQSRTSRRKTQVLNQPESPTRSHPESVIQSIEALLGEDQRPIEHSDPVEDSEEETPLSPLDTDLEQIFNHSWGYLPPLDREALALIDTIIANPAMAEQLKRIGPESAEFYWGLKQRNISLEESQDSDPYTESIDQIKLLPTPDMSGPETEDEKELHGQLWIQDQAKCNEGSNEALFQRTMMMSLIARHCFIYAKNASDQRCIDFSVEETWTCPPMPTRAFEKKKPFLTQPKPDLAVYFRRQALIPEELWLEMPSATQRLACCENAGDIGENRVFHFLTIEAKKGQTAINDKVGKLQSLNNASQALHNMYEFFHDAGPQHEDNFFTKVRFFSVVASTEGLIIRIHRATRRPADGSGPGFIKPGYPLRFEYRVFSKFQKDNNFERETVLKTFRKILLGYAEKELRGLLSGAAKAIMARLSNDPQGRLARENFGFYLYGQTAPKSKNQTPAARSESIVSVDMLRNDLSGTVTPGATSKSPTPKRVSELGGSGGKRKRGQSDDSQPSRRTHLRT